MHLQEICCLLGALARLGERGVGIGVPSLPVRTDSLLVGGPFKLGKAVFMSRQGYGQGGRKGS